MSFISAEKTDKQAFSLKWDDTCRRVSEELLSHLESHQMEIFLFEYLVLWFYSSGSRYIWQRRVTGKGKFVPILFFLQCQGSLYIFKVETACLFILIFLNDINIYTCWSCFSHQPPIALPVGSPSQNVDHYTKIS